jgi:CheY-like chemotaxis protein
MRKCLEITFSGTEFNLVAVGNAQEALEKVKTLSPDLVIADVSLPPNDGYELCSTIKLAAPGIPVMMLSSKQNPFDATKGAQADDHIDKPFDTQVMQDRARSLVKPTEKSDTDVPGAVPERHAQMPTMPDRAAASSKIPAPRRKRPTPAMLANPLAPHHEPHTPTPHAVSHGSLSGASGAAAQPHATSGPHASPAGAMRRTVPFAMPGSAKRAGSVPIGTSPGLSPKSGSTQPIGEREQAASDRLGQMQAQTVKGFRRTQPQSTPPELAPEAGKKPSGDTLPGVPGNEDGHDVAQVPADADLETKLTALGLTRTQVEGVLSLSRELIEQVVWDVVPTLAETLIKEEIRRLTSE